jgi:dUTP pyrophosphatase
MNERRGRARVRLEMTKETTTDDVLSRNVCLRDARSAYDYVVPARGKELVKTDLSVAIPRGTYARVAPRSGLAWKKFIDVGAGVVDYDYRGNVGVILFNHGEEDFVVRKGDRVAQLILERIVTPDVVECDDLDDTERGAGGFGSTGVSTKDGSSAPADASA